MIIATLVAFALVGAATADAQSKYPAPYYFITFAGSSFGGDGTGNQAIFRNPHYTLHTSLPYGDSTPCRAACSRKLSE